MENKLELNKKPKYELPDEVAIGLYMNKYQDVSFNPDICLCVWGAGNCGKIRKYKEDAKQICIKTNNDKLIEFIKEYNWRDISHKTASYDINLWKFKKIILEEFYGVKYGE